MASAVRGKRLRAVEGLICTPNIALLSVHSSEDLAKITSNDDSRSSLDHSTYLIKVVLFAVICDINKIIDTRYWVFPFSGYKQEDSLRETRPVREEDKRARYVPLSAR